MTDRREFVRTLSLAALIGPGAGRSRRWGALRYQADPFSLGVSSGDPAPDGFVLWTRLAPDPLRGGGMPPEAVPVRWEIAADEGMRRVVRRGTATALPELAHSVHVEAAGLAPDRWYWYRFMTGGAVSPTGRARTAPPPGVVPERFSFAFVSCQHYEQGYYTAFRHVAREDVRMIVHLGDYIYEDGVGANAVRPHTGPEVKTLEQYRDRYALYQTDPDLQAAHAAAPWVVTWDDHEVDNNYANLVSEHNDPVEEFRLRRAAAYQAYYEHLPVRASARPRGPDARLYRTVDIGALARFSVLDTRQYRTDQPCGDREKPPCPERLDPAATMMGPDQERWFEATFGRGARWNVVANQVFMAKNDRKPGEGELYNMDSWNGYPLARRRFLDLVAERGRGNTVVLTGDVHSSWANDLLADFDNPDSAVVASELVGTSISSGGDGVDQYPGTEAALRENPHIKFSSARRGYVRCAIEPDGFHADFRTVAAVSRLDAPVTTATSFQLIRGRPGLQAS